MADLIKRWSGYKVIHLIKKFMDQYIVKVKSIYLITHDVLKIVTEKPPLYNFKPGQATDVSLNIDGWRDEKRPFTFTSLPTNDYLEFTIKTYPSHMGLTNKLLQMEPGDELILKEAYGAIAYQGEGIFIAGGAGITPFISILRFLQSKNEIGNNKLLYANKTKADIILEAEFKQLLNHHFFNILSKEKVDGYEEGLITEAFIKSNIAGTADVFYVCGPPLMMAAIGMHLKNLNIKERSIVREEF